MTGRAEVRVTPQSNGIFQVEVSDPRGCTAHIVEVPAGMADALNWGEAGEAELVRESFAFLLEREPPTSILQRFSLEAIGRYFPEYPTEMSRHRT